MKQKPIHDIKERKVSSYYITHNRMIARDSTHSIFFMPVQVRVALSKYIWCGARFYLSSLLLPPSKFERRII
jgi:hypothetical protein